MISPKTKGARGFTLVEIVVALFILSAAIVFAALVIGTIKVTRDSAFENVAFRIADNKVNELRALGYAALPASGAFSDPQIANLPQGEASTTITVWNAKTKQVVAGVSWLGAEGRTRSVSITTLVTESGGL
ncbi:MAG: prepilin-type N-terminal cleavage/methylation domain-containing protein [Candidatus Pacebacteria bacterium]|nr:prepilin-type N-terminal cleavage/methylation domain-containing protein [Candidatus Paceibacterota bacterium]